MGHWWKRKFSGKNLFRYHFVYNKSHVGSNPDLRGERPATNALTHGAAFYVLTTDSVPITKTKRLCYLGEKSLFVVAIIRNPWIHGVGKMQFLVLKEVVRAKEGVLKV